MDLQIFKSIVDTDPTIVILCDLQDKIIYMNPTAQNNYQDRLHVGDNLLNCHNAHTKEIIHQVVAWFLADKEHNIIHTFFNPKQNKDVYMVALRDAQENVIGYYERHAFRTKDETPFYEFQGKFYKICGIYDAAYGCEERPEDAEELVEIDLESPEGEKKTLTVPEKSFGHRIVGDYWFEK